MEYFDSEENRIGSMSVLTFLVRKYPHKYLDDPDSRPQKRRICGAVKR